MKLQVKFRPGASNQQVDEVLGALVERGAAEVRPMFPGSGDAELGALYVVETDGAGRDGMLRLLDRCDVVEFAEPEARRKLARSA
jgi:hypothetical protein